MLVVLLRNSRRRHAGAAVGPAFERGSYGARAGAAERLRFLWRDAVFRAARL